MSDVPVECRQWLDRRTSSGYVNVSPTRMPVIFSSARALCMEVTVYPLLEHYKTLGSAPTVCGCVSMVLAITRDRFPLQH